MNTVTKLEVIDRLKLNADSMNLKEIISILHSHGNILSKRESKTYGVINFKLIKGLIDEGIMSNDMNREEELDVKKSYKNKLIHLIRYVDGVSRKSHLQLSFNPTKKNTLFISDDGTMMSLCFGQFFDSKKLTGEEIIEILKEIKQNYELDGTESFYNDVGRWVDSLNEELKVKMYSLKDIISNTKSQDYYDNTTINYEINYFSTRLHIKDQQNANLQPNPWIPHNFYKAFVKALEAYKTTFLGDTLQTDVFTKVKGVGYDPNNQADRLFRTYCKNAKKAEIEIPFYTTKSALLSVDSFQEILDYNKYFIDYSKHEEKESGGFWYGSYENLVSNVKYSEMLEFVEDFKIAVEGGWSDIRSKIGEIQRNVDKSCGAFEDLTPFKDDFGMYAVFVVLSLHKLMPAAFSRTPSKNIEKIKTTLIQEIIKNLDRDIEDENFEETVKLFELFSRDGYRNWSSRFKYVWEPAIKKVYSTMENKKKGEKSFDREVDHQKDSIKKILRDNGWGSIYNLCSHQTDDLIKLDFNDSSKNMAGLHCVPVANGGTASDGVIWGLVDDNEGNWKFKDLNKMFNKPSDYWVSLGKANEDMLERKKDTLSENEKKYVRKFINLCDEIGIKGIDYLTKTSA